ncbi:MAG: hypothetical protein Q8882_05990 [Bacillota bacterium]|nr:hypothetical protein [Bacillota bacterium]
MQPYKEASKFLIKLLKSDDEDTKDRLKAAELILKNSGNESLETKDINVTISVKE